MTDPTIAMTDGSPTGRGDREAAFAAADPARAGDDVGSVEEGMEPAIVAIPTGGPERMPGMASAGLPPVHPEEAANRHRKEATDRAEAAKTNRFQIVGDASPDIFLVDDMRQTVAGSTSSLRCPETSTPEGLAWLILPASGSLASLGTEASGKIRIALAPRTVDAILGLLAGAAEGLESASATAFRGVFEAAGPSDRLDSTAPSRPPCVRAAPDRIASRPRPDEWRDDELLTLPEAARLFWPDGPLTTTSLRTAARDGTLEIRTVAGRHMTTPAALRRLGLPRTEGPAEGLSVTAAAASMLGRLERRR